MALVFRYSCLFSIVYSFTLERNMNQTGITQALPTCAGILGLLGSVACYGAMNNIQYLLFRKGV